MNTSIEHRDAFIQFLSRRYRNSHPGMMILPTVARKYDLEGGACPACPKDSSKRLRRDDQDYICSDPKSALQPFDKHVQHRFHCINPVYSDICFGEIWTVKVMFWPPKPADDYLAWPPRVTKLELTLECHDDTDVSLENLYGNEEDTDSDARRDVIYGTKPDWDYISYYDMEDSAWVTVVNLPYLIPVCMDRPVLLRHFTVQDDQCLGWEAAVEAAGFKVVKPIRKGQGAKELFREESNSRPTKRRRVTPASSGSCSTASSGNSQRVGDRRERGQNESGTSRGKPSWWMTMSAGAVITGLKEMERIKDTDRRATLQQRFERVFPGEQFVLPTVKRMIASFSHLSEEDIERYLNEEPERPWSEVYALAK